jgi:hypothetical protein
MERLYCHRGIIFLIHRVGKGHWEWRLVPPKDVQGLWPENGTVYGEIRTAIEAAKSAIARQTRRHSHGAGLRMIEVRRLSPESVHPVGSRQSRL